MLPNHFLPAKFNGPFNILAALLISFYSVSASPGNFLFTENKGQIGFYGPKEDTKILYYAETRSINYYITNKGISYCFTNMEEEEKESGRKIRLKFKNNTTAKEEEEDHDVHYARVDMNLENAEISFENIQTSGKSEFLSNYYTASCPTGITGVNSFEKLIIKNVYPKIDWILYNSSSDGFKYDFIVHPGGDINKIKLNYKWCKIKMLEDGGYCIHTPLGEVKEYAPYCFQLNATVNSKYSRHANTIGFEIPSYDKTQDLIIDPALSLYWGTYYGGNNSFDGFNDVCRDASDNLYIAGYTAANNFPTLDMGGGAYFTGAYVGGVDDVLITKFDANGVRKWATYYGGTGTEQAYSCRIDGNNKLYVTGRTGSSDFPTLALAGGYNDNTLTAGTDDMFLLRFNTSGVRDWATYIGGDGGDWGMSMAIDASNNLFLTGYSGSTNFPVTNPGGGAYYSAALTGGASYDVVILKFTSAGVKQWATYYGGDGQDKAYGICVDASNNVYVTGQTSSSTTAFPTLAWGGAYNQAAKSTSSDAFILKFNNSGVRQWATHFGANSNDYGYDIAVSSTGQITIYGESASTNLPVVNPGGGAYYQAANAGGSDSFIAQFANTGAQRWCTYYGGTGNEFWGAYKAAITLDNNDNIYVTGLTYATDYPTLNPGGSAFYQGANAGGSESTITVFDKTGVRQWATYVGSTANDFGTSCLITSTGYLIAVGEWPAAGSSGVLNPGGSTYYSAYSGAGGDDSYIMKFGALTLPVSLTDFRCSVTGDGFLQLNWVTESEINNEYFVVEKSKDAESFYECGKIAGNGTSSIKHTYHFVDRDSKQEKIYYRLRQVDYDGKFTIHNLIYADCAAQNPMTQISIYPNPSAGQINLIMFSAVSIEGLKIQMTDVLGRVVYIREINVNEGENIFNLTPEYLPPGIYTLTAPHLEFPSLKIVRE